MSKCENISLELILHKSGRIGILNIYIYRLYYVIVDLLYSEVSRYADEHKFPRDKFVGLCFEHRRV